MKEDKKTKAEELSDDMTEQVTGGTWGSEKPINNWESFEGTTPTIITNGDHQWLHEDSSDQENTSAWYGLKNNP